MYLDYTKKGTTEAGGGGCYRQLHNSCVALSVPYTVNLEIVVVNHNIKTHVHYVTLVRGRSYKNF